MFSVLFFFAMGVCMYNHIKAGPPTDFVCPGFTPISIFCRNTQGGVICALVKSGVQVYVGGSEHPLGQLIPNVGRLAAARYELHGQRSGEGPGG